MREFTYDDWCLQEPPDEDLGDVEPGDPAVAFALVAAAVLVLAATLFLTSGLPFRMHERMQPPPPAPAVRARLIQA